MNRKTKIIIAIVVLIFAIPVVLIIAVVGFIALRENTDLADDIKRMSDSTTIQATLEFRQLNLGHYPIQTTCVDVKELIYQNEDSVSKTMQEGWEPEYNKNTQSPATNQDETGYYYITDALGTDYRLIAKLKNPEHEQLQTPEQQNIGNIQNTTPPSNCDCSPNRTNGNYCAKPRNTQ